MLNNNNNNNNGVPTIHGSTLAAKNLMLRSAIAQLKLDIQSTRTKCVAKQQELDEFFVRVVEEIKRTCACTNKHRCSGGPHIVPKRGCDEFCSPAHETTTSMETPRSPFDCSQNISISSVDRKQRRVSFSVGTPTDNEVSSSSQYSHPVATCASQCSASDESRSRSDVASTMSHTGTPLPSEQQPESVASDQGSTVQQRQQRRTAGTKRGRNDHHVPFIDVASPVGRPLLSRNVKHSKDASLMDGSLSSSVVASASTTPLASRDPNVVANKTAHPCAAPPRRGRLMLNNPFFDSSPVSSPVEETTVKQEKHAIQEHRNAPSTPLHRRLSKAPTATVSSPRCMRVGMLGEMVAARRALARSSMILRMAGGETEIIDF